MVASWDLGKVNADLAAAALDPGKWKSALQCISEETGAVGAVLLPPVDQRGHSIGTDGVAETTERYIVEGWSARDLRDRALPTLLRRGIAVDLDYANEEEIKRSEYYNEFLGRHRLRWSAVIALQFHGLWAVSIQRSIEQGPFLDNEQKLLGRLRGPLSTAATISRALGLARAEGLADAFDVLGYPAMLVDGFGRVARMNSTAEAQMSSDLCIVHRRLTAAQHEVTKRIQHLIHDASCSSSGAQASLSPPVAVPRIGRRPLLVYAVPITGDNVFSAGRVLVIVLDLESRPVPRAMHLRQAFGLTAAEARLASRLAAGESLESAADAVGVAKETARTQLKAVFGKTSTGRQAELVALIGRLFPEPVQS